MCLRWIAGLVLLMAAETTLHAQDPTPTYREHQDLGYYLTAAGEKRPIRTAEDWQIRRQHILAHLQQVMGRLPKPEQPVPLEVEVHETVVDGMLVRKKISYHTDSLDRRVFAYLLLPADAKPGQAAMLCLHQTTPLGKAEPIGLGPNPNLHYAQHLARRGYVTLSPDYPSFGDYEYDFPAAEGYVSGSMKAIYDNLRAVDVLESLPEVDSDRIGCIGHSLGGHNAIFTAVFEPRIKAVVSCCGFTRFHKYYEGRLAGWTSNRYMPRIASEYGNDPDRVPFDFPELIASLAPRGMLAVAPVNDANFEVSGVQDSLASALPIYRLLEAEPNLQATYPQAAHDFPAESREIAYRFIDEQLRARP
jgi:dienelactone hydrolase